VHCLLFDILFMSLVTIIGFVSSKFSIKLSNNLTISGLHDQFYFYFDKIFSLFGRPILLVITSMDY
jgi:hypothetical protein